MTAEPVLGLRADLHGHVIDYACDVDRAWFASHPGALWYTREPFDHELCVPFEVCTDLTGQRVRVTRLAPGVCARRAVAT